MKQFLLIAISFITLSCTTNDTELKAPEYLQYRIDKAVLVSRLQGVDSADVNVQYVKKTKFFKKSSHNNLLLTLHVVPEQNIDDAFIEKQVKFNKLTLEREILNYFSYDGLVIEFYQRGEKVHTHEESFKE